MKRLWRAASLGLILTLVAFTFPLDLIAMSENSKNNFMIMRCKTSGDLLLSDAVVRFIPPKEGELDFYWYSEFICAWNSTSTVDVTVEWTGNMTVTQFELSEITITTADFFINGSMTRISFWDTPSSLEVPINITKEQTVFTAKYFLNLSSPLQKAREKFLNALNLTSQTGMDRIGGRLSFRAIHLDCLSKDGRLELITFTFSNEKANIFVLHVEALIPTDAELLQAEINGNAMDRRLNALTGSAFFVPGNLESRTTKIQWLLPKVPKWWETLPWMWFIAAIIGGILSPILITLGRKAWNSKPIYGLRWWWYYRRLRARTRSWRSIS